LLFAFAGNIGYYLALTLAIHYAGIALPALIVGALPVTMMIYANIKNKEFSFQRLLIPISLILIGIVALKYFQYSEEIASEKNLTQMLIGAAWSLSALAIWTWFGVANANYLKTNFRISGYSWSIAIGVCCLLQVLIIFPVLLFFNKETVMTSLQQPDVFYQLMIGGFILGAIVSWLATVWWNKISRHLPTTLAAQLLVFETISSLLYGYILDRTYPQPMILVCISIVLLGIVAGIHITVTSKKSLKKEN
jgi:drug/metabolite transporter (DMT)-like permease